MIVQFGNASFAANTVGVEIDREYELDRWGRPWLEKQTWNLNIRVKRPNPYSINSLDIAIAQMENVFAPLVAPNVRILHRDGTTPTVHSIAPGTTLGGVRLIRGPSYAKYQNGELGTFRTANVVLETYIAQFTNATRVIDCGEDINGPQTVGPTYALLQPNVGFAQLQQTRTHQHIELTQSGFITCAGTYYRIPPAILQNGQMAVPKLSVKQPRAIGGGNGVPIAHVGYRIDYTYPLASNVSTVALPTRFSPS